MNIAAQLRHLEKNGTRIAKLKKRLLGEARARKTLAARLECLVRASGLPPRDLVFALVDHYKIRLAGRRKNQGRPRRRTTITAELRDAVKNKVNGGVSMNRAAKEFAISYAVVIKMMRGHYDKLQWTGALTPSEFAGRPPTSARTPLIKSARA
jgi:hypothetical protein